MNAIGAPLRGPIHSEMTHYQLTAWVNSVTESGREEMSLGACIRVNLGVENERAGAGWDSRTYLAKLNSQVRTWTVGRTDFSCFN